MENNIFKTKNLFVATYLQASGKVKYLGLESLDFKTKLFKFSNLETCKDLENDYFSGGALPAKTLFSEYNSLKDILFSKNTNEY